MEERSRLLPRLTRYLVEDDPSIHVVAVGPHSRGRIPELHLDAQRLGVEQHLHLIGPVDDTTILLRRKRTFFVLPSREDPFPLVMLEAAAQGIPIVGFCHSGGFEEFATGNAALAVPYLDSQAMSHAVLRILNDDRERQAMTVKRLDESTRRS